MVLHSPITRIRIHTHTNPVTPSRRYTASPAIPPSMPKTAMPLPAITMVAIIDLIDIGAIDIGGIVDGDFPRHSSVASDQPRWRYQGADATGLSPVTAGRLEKRMVLETRELYCSPSGNRLLLAREQRRRFGEARTRLGLPIFLSVAVVLHADDRSGPIARSRSITQAGA